MHLGAPSELLIEGPLVGRGYLQDEQDKVALIVVVRLWWPLAGEIRYMLHIHLMFRDTLEWRTWNR